MDKSMSAVTSYVSDLPLPVPLESMGEAESLAPTFIQEPQAVSVGSQLTEFTANVPPDVRAAVSDSMLLAQLAANKAASTDNSAGVFAWYDKYREVLEGIGW